MPNWKKVIVSGSDASLNSLNVATNVIISGSLLNGFNLTANGTSSHAEGQNTNASGSYSHAEGRDTIALGVGSHAEGSADYELIDPEDPEAGTTILPLQAIGGYSHAEGQKTTSGGQYSHAEGYGTISTGSWSHAEGGYTIASGSFSHAEGSSTLASGGSSHAEGQGTSARGYGSHAEGGYTIASNNYSHAEGNGTVASGLYAHAEGAGTIASAEASHAAGYFTVASGSYQTVVGRLNLSSSAQSAFIIGNGISNNNASRSNLVFASGSAFQITGSAIITGSLIVTGSSNLSGSLTISGNTIMTGSVIATAGITGSLFGTASWSVNAITASYFSGSISNAIYAETASYVTTAQTASYFFTSSVTSASYAETSNSSSYALTASYSLSSSYSNNSTTASYAQYVEYANVSNKPTLISSSAQIATDISGAFTSTSASLSATINNVIATTVTTSSFNSFTSSYTTGSFTGSFSGNGSGLTGVISSSYAESASYALTSSYSISSSYATSASIAISSTNTADILIYVKNITGAPITKGKVVRITGATGDNALIATASYEADSISANTLGILNETIANDAFGYAMTEGSLIGIDTDTFTAGQLLFLGPTGSIIGYEPAAPLHAVRLGQALRIQQIVGSMYVRIDNGYELDELHNVLIISGSDGDLLVASGSNGNGKKLYINSRQLTGSYGLTGSLTITGSTSTDLFRITQTGTGNSFVVEDSNNPDSTPFVVDAAGNVGIGTSTPLNKIHIISAAPDLLQIERTGGANSHIRYKNTVGEMWAGLSPAGNFGIGNGIDLTNNSQLTVISSSGNVGIGTTTPTQKLTVSGGSILLDNSTALKHKNASGTELDMVTLNAGNSLFLGSGQRDIYFRAGNNNIVYVTSSAVGIGTTTPNATLDVNGNTIITGSLTVSGSSRVIGTLNADGVQNIRQYNTNGNWFLGSLSVGKSGTANKTLDVNGDALITGSLTVTNGITGSLFGTASYAANSKLFDGNDTAVFATTASNTFKASQTITGSLTITNDLIVFGSSSIQYITSSQLNIATNLINVNTNTPAVRFGGIAVNDSGSSPIRSGSFLFDSQENHWLAIHENGGGVTTSSLFLMGPETYNSVGSETHPTTNRVLKSVNNEHVGDSNITDTGTLVSINSNTQITGSVLISGSLTVGGVIFGNGGMSMSGSNNITGSLIITGSTSTDLVRITQTGTGKAFVVEDSTNPDTSNFTIDANGSVGIGAGTDPTYKLYVNSSETAIFGQSAFNNGVYGSGQTGVVGAGSNVGVYGYGVSVGVQGDAGQTDEFGTIVEGIGGKFSANTSYGSNPSYSVQLQDTTEGIGKVLVSQTADGKANWSTKLSGSYEITGSLKVSGSYNSPAGNTIDSNALIQASLLYLSNNF